MVLLYGRTGRLTAKNGGFWPGQYSPYVVAGYMPAAPQLIKQQVLELLADGESVLAVRVQLPCVWTYRDRSLEID
jgi:hypothetical protein